MSHHTYTTPAFVLHGIDVGEGSRSLLLYTKELGLVYGLARSLREARSKLRFALQPLSLAEVSLVRGKDVWRVTGAREGVNYYHTLRGHAEKQEVVARVMAVVRRLIRGEEPEEGLFNLLERGFAFLVEAQLSPEEIALCECVLVFQLLFKLGHVPPFVDVEDLHDVPLTRDSLQGLLPFKRRLVAHINRGLTAAQL